MFHIRRTAAIVLGLAALSLFAPDLALAGTAPQHRSDGMVRLREDSRYRGSDIYNRTGAGQSRTKRIRKTGAGFFYVHVQNDGTVSDTFRIQGSRDNRRFSIRYYTRGRNVTRQVKAGTVLFRGVPPGGHRGLIVVIKTRAGVPLGSRITATVAARSLGNGSLDVTKSTLHRPNPYSSDQLTVRRQVNATRAAYGRRGLVMNASLAKKAQSWAQYLSQLGRLQHSNLRSGAPSNWKSLAENVGYGSSLTSVHNAFLRSSGHRANILGSYTHLGTGVARAGSRVYVVHVFMRV